ncbi:hypothetical protein [Maricaulis sp.]|uniref:hypothetical protein n=1 Tax=Maricaulis sp. TaxID=1486257 RepID=UPI003A8F1C80
MTWRALRTRAAASALLALALILMPTVHQAEAQDEPDIWLTACNISDPQVLTTDQMACVSALTSSVLGEDRTFLDVPRVEFPAYVSNAHGCGHSRVQPVWPIDAAGEQIRLNVSQAVVEVSFDVLKDGSVANVDPHLIEPEASGFPDAEVFEAAAASAAEGRHHCEQEQTTRETMRFIFQLDETIP